MAEVPGVMMDHQEAKGRQGYRMVSLFSLRGWSVRVTIYRDSYDDQSYARIEFLTGEGWKELHALLRPTSLDSSCIDVESRLQDLMVDDRERLLVTADRLLRDLNAT